jgi:hypothetical protein
LKIKNLKFKITTKSSGQVALIVLLISAVGMTIGLGMFKKKTANLKVETNEEELKQAFNTAESGVEYFLVTGKTQFTAIDSLSKADVVTKNIGEGSTVNFDQYTLPNTNVIYWLVAHTVDGGIDMGTYYTGTDLSLCLNNTFNGAVKVDYFYRNPSGNYKVVRLGYNLTADLVGGFSNINPVQGSCASSYRQVALTAALPMGLGTPLILAVKPIGVGGKFYLLGNGPLFPVQGVNITATGKVGDINTGVKRKINVIQTYQMPSFALEAITAFGNVLSN